MKKSKKALLWTIVPVLGVSSGVAGAVAGTKDQTTSVGTNNVATPATATTMSARNSNVSDGIKITSQTRDVLAYSGLEPQTNLSVQVSGAHELSVLSYKWYINKGNGWELHVSSTNRGVIPITIPKVSTITNWTFRCVVTETKVGSSTVTSDDIKFTIVPKGGRLIEVSQPVDSKTVNGGDIVTLSTFAKGISTYSGKDIGYQWFEYDSNEDKFTKIDEAIESSYTFTVPYFTTQKTKKYVCRYYIKNSGQPITYLSESNQSIITINKTAKEQVEFKNLQASAYSLNVGQKTTLSVEAKSTISKDLKYQWFKLDSDGLTFREIQNANTQTYEYEAKEDDAGKELTFMVRATGVIQDGLQNYFQSDNVKIKVASLDGSSGTNANQTFTNNLSVSSSVTTNQASVRKTFYPIGGTVKSPEYTVDVKGETGLTYKWYYVGRDGRSNLIQNAIGSTLKTNKNLYEAAYKDNSNHKVGIKCEIYKDGKLIQTVDEKTNNRFYMTVVITRR